MLRTAVIVVAVVFFVAVAGIWPPAAVESFETEPGTGKLRLQPECRFSGVGFSKKHEVGECSVAYQIIPLCRNVLEIGGGTGKVSHAINALLQRRGLGRQHVVVEPGSGGRGNHGDTALYTNRARLKDQYTVVKKFANDLTASDLRALDGGVPDCLYVDCEGCLLSFQKTALGSRVLKSATYVVNEMDGHNDALRAMWRSYGFRKVAVGYGCGTRCDTEVWKKTRPA